MDNKTKHQARKLSSSDLDMERAAMSGYESVEAFRHARILSAGPRSTREASGGGSHDNVQGMHAGDFSKKRRRKDSELDAGTEGWYYIDNSGQEQGPYPANQMHSWYVKGELLPETQVKKGTSGMVRLASTSTVMTGMSTEQLRSMGKERSDVDWRKHRVYVGNLACSVNESSLSELFRQFGTLTDVNVPCEGEKRNRGFGFVSFETAEASAAAIEKLDGHLLDGQKLRVNMANNRTTKKHEHDQLTVNTQSVEHGEWVKMTDPSSSGEYYWNVLTDEKSWELPAHVRNHPVEGTKKGGGAGALAALLNYDSDST